MRQSRTHSARQPREIARGLQKCGPGGSTIIIFTCASPAPPAASSVHRKSRRSARMGAEGSSRIGLAQLISRAVRIRRRRRRSPWTICRRFVAPCSMLNDSTAGQRVYRRQQEHAKHCPDNTQNHEPFLRSRFFFLSNGADKVILSKKCHPVRRFPGVAMLRNLIGARRSKVSRDRIVLVSDPVYRDQTVKQEQWPNGPDIRTGH